MKLKLAVPSYETRCEKKGWVTWHNFKKIEKKYYKKLTFSRPGMNDLHLIALNIDRSEIWNCTQVTV